MTEQILCAFSGLDDEDVEVFVGKVDKALHDASWNDLDAANQVLSKLDGLAKDFTDSLNTLDRESWRLLREKLLSQFSKTSIKAHDDDDTMSEAKSPLSLRDKIDLRKSLKQSKKESVRTFYKRCRSAQEIISDELDPPEGPVFEKYVLLNFVLGLRKDYQEAVIEAGEAAANDLDSYVEAAVRVEADFKRNKSIKDGNVGEDVKVKLETSNGDDDFADLEADELLASKVESKIEVKDEPMDNDNNEDGENEGTYGGEGDFPHMCSCGQSFPTEFQLKSHIEKEHSIENSKLSCEHCPTTFATMRGFKIHMDLQHSELTYQCDICDHVSYSMKLHVVHITIGHRPESDKFVCRLCSQEFNILRSLRNHVNEHHVHEKPFPCNVCDRSFRTPKKLEDHMRSSHLNEKPHKCHLCDKAFVAPSGLKYHKRSAHGIGSKFKCEQCDKEFNGRQALQFHIARYHTGASYVCEDCGQSFAVKEVLKNHIYRKHSGLAKDIKCDFYPECKTLVRDEQELKRHIKSVHDRTLFTHTCDYCPQKFRGKST